MKKTLVVILTKNRYKLFSQTITSLHKNTPRELFDVMVIDDGSEIEHIAYIYGLKSGEMVDHLIATKTGSLGFNKNIGAEFARFLGYEYVYQSDDDMYFLPGWLEKCLNAIDAPKELITVIGAYCHPFLQPNNDLKLNTLNTVDAINGNSMFMRTKDWAKYKMQETNGIMASEDWEMCQRIRKAGGLCVKFTENLVLHCGITNSCGEPATGADLMLEELSQAKVKYNLDIQYE